MQRIGMFGGSFNPVQCGHLLVARAAIEELRLNRLFFIPAAQSPFKPGIALAPDADRLRFLRLALAGWTDCEIDTQELDRGGVSFTIDTVRHYASQFPGASLYWMIGSDHARALPQWRAAEELATLAEFVIIPRPGEGAAALPRSFRGRALQGFPVGISSSQIRARVKAGLPIEGLTPPAVVEAIRNSQLYL